MNKPNITQEQRELWAQQKLIEEEITTERNKNIVQLAENFKNWFLFFFVMFILVSVCAVVWPSTEIFSTHLFVSIFLIGTVAHFLFCVNIEMKSARDKIFKRCYKSNK